MSTATRDTGEGVCNLLALRIVSDVIMNVMEHLHLMEMLSGDNCL